MFFEVGVEMRDAMRIHEVNRGRQMRVNEGNGSLSRFFTRLDLLCQPFKQILWYIFAKTTPDGQWRR